MAIKYFLTILAFASLFYINSALCNINCPSNIKVNLENKKEFKEKFSQSVFQVFVKSDGPPQKEETLGTATLIGGDGYLLTAAHIFQADKNRVLEGINNNKFRLFLRIPADENNHLVYKGVYIKNLSDKLDLSILKLLDWNNKRSYSPVLLDVKSNPHDNEARLIGYIVNDRFPIVSEKGNIIRTSDADGYLRATKLSAYNGFSGGMLINSDGMGVAVLSGKYTKNNDGDINWGQIGDMNNDALNASPLRSVIDQLANLDLTKTDHFLNRLKTSTNTIPNYELNDLIKNNRLSATALAYRLTNIGHLKGLSNRENRWNIFTLTDCLMPEELTKKAFFNFSQNSTSEKEKEWFSNETVKYALKEARESKDLKYSLDKYDLAVTAMNSAKLDEDYSNYAYLDYYKALIEANKQGIELDRLKNPSVVIGTSVRNITENVNQYVLSSKSLSRALIFSAATKELNKKGEYYDGSITAIAALKSAKSWNDRLVSDSSYMSTKAANSVADKAIQETLKQERSIINSIGTKPSDIGGFSAKLEKIQNPTRKQLLKSVEKLGVIGKTYP